MNRRLRLHASVRILVKLLALMLVAPSLAFFPRIREAIEHLFKSKRLSPLRLDNGALTDKLIV